MNKIMTTLVCALTLVGCTPDTVIVTIPTSQILLAQSGEVGYATAKVTYSVIDNNGKKQLAKCKAIAEKYVGEGGSVNLSGGLDPEDDNAAYLTATFKMPIVSPENRNKIKFVPPAALMLNNGALGFSAMTDALNKELKKIDNGITAEFNGGKTVFRLIGDSDKPVKYGVFGTFLNDKPVISVAINVEKGHEYKALFYRSSEHIWHEIDPFVNVLK